MIDMIIAGPGIKTSGLSGVVTVSVDEAYIQALVSKMIDHNNFSKEVHTYRIGS